MKIQISKSEQDNFLQSINSRSKWKLTIPKAFNLEQHHQFRQFEPRGLLWSTREFSCSLYESRSDISDFDVLADYVEQRLKDLDNWDKKTGAERTGKAVREMIVFLENKGVLKEFAEEVSKVALLQFKLNDVDLGANIDDNGFAILQKVFVDFVEEDIINYESEHGSAFDNFDFLEEPGIAE